MNRFISDTDKSRSIISLPEEMKLTEPFTLPEALGEYDLKKVMQNLAGRNISASDAVCFLGAGNYDHFVPSLISKVAGDFIYADRKARLRAANDYRTYMKAITGMDEIAVTVKNTADAFAEALTAVAGITSKRKLAVARSSDPELRRAIRSYAEALSFEVREIPCPDGDTDPEGLKKIINEDYAAVFVQSPNYFGIIEDMQSLSNVAHSASALFIAGIDPVSLAIIKTPGEYNADFAVGNAQPFGGAMYYGTPYIGILGVKKEYESYISDCLIKEEGDSFTCVNECKIPFAQAFSAASYIELMGANGLRTVAETCYSNACYTYEKLTATSSFKALFNKPYFREFAVKATKKNVNDINNRMLDYGMIGGAVIKNDYPEFGNSWLVAVTEKRSADEVELLVKEASRQI